jgi:DNA-binding phage protein
MGSKREYASGQARAALWGGVLMRFRNVSKRGRNNMAKKVWKRVFRTGKLTAEQVARDQRIRRLVQAEFPPSPRPAIPRSLSASLKKAMKRSPKTSYQLAKEAGVSQIMVSRFLSGKRDIRLATADRLAHALGLKLVAS